MRLGKLRIDFSFVLVLSLALVFGQGDLLELLIFSSLHELAHLAALYACGGRADELRLSFYGAGLRYCASLTTAQEFFVIISAPLLNLLLHFILHDGINLLLFLVNILPVYPLDGGRALCLFLPKTAEVISKIFIVILAVTAIYLLIFYHSFSLVLITGYLVIMRNE